MVILVLIAHTRLGVPRLVRPDSVALGPVFEVRRAGAAPSRSRPAGTAAPRATGSRPPPWRRLASQGASRRPPPSPGTATTTRSARRGRERPSPTTSSPAPAPGAGGSRSPPRRPHAVAGSNGRCVAPTRAPRCRGARGCTTPLRGPSARARARRPPATPRSRSPGSSGSVCRALPRTSPRPSRPTRSPSASRPSACRGGSTPPLPPGGPVRPR